MKLGAFAPIKFISSVYEESRKVVWPTRQEIIRHTIIVLIAIVVAGAIFALIDFGFQKLVISVLSRIGI